MTTSEETPVSATALVTTNTVLAKLDKGASLNEVLKDLVPDVRSESIVKVSLAKPIKLSEGTVAAVNLLPATVENAVCPTERRTLTTDEVAQLLTERTVLDAVEKVIKARKDAQKVIVYNHYDVDVEARLGEGARTLEVDDNGFYIVEAGVDAPGYEKGFVRQVRDGSPVLTEEALKAQIGVGDFTHEDYLACTTQVRVIDEAKIMLALRAKPTVITEALRHATQPGRKTTAHALGKVK